MDHYKYYWVGPRESDIDCTGDLFQGSVTIYGSNGNGNISGSDTINRRANHNLFEADINDCMVSAERKVCKDTAVRFMLYNQEIISCLPQDIIDRIVFANDADLIERLNNKLYFRQWAEKFVNVPNYTVVRGGNMDFDMLSGVLGTSRLIIQELFSSGGISTYCCDKNTFSEINPQWNPDADYLVSEDLNPCIPLNMHGIVGEEQVIAFPGSVQLIVPGNHKMLYRGGDYCAYDQLHGDIRRAFRNGVLLLGEKLRKTGYRGVFGIDAVLKNRTLYFLEINPRFQASSRLLNVALAKNGYPSLQHMHIMAFRGMPLPEETDTLPVTASFFTYHHSEITVLHGNHIIQNAADSGFALVPNGYGHTDSFSPDAYLFEITANKNIADIKSFDEIRLLPNLTEPTAFWLNGIYNGNSILLKIALLNRGVRLADPLAAVYKEAYRQGVNYSLDLRLPGFTVNCPVNIPVTAFTPFLIKEKNGNPHLYCYEKEVCEVTLYPAETLLLKETASGAFISDICLASTDRLRIRHTRNCCFGADGNQCRFCGDAAFFDWSKPDYTLADLEEAIRCFFDSCTFRHILIGGPSSPVASEQQKIISILRYLRNFEKKPIYLMCLPPKDVSVFPVYRELGITEVAFNIEIYDRVIAGNLMPVKGKIPFEQYEKALKAAVTVWGNTGNVRTSFVAGLEPAESLLRGVEWCCKLGAAPIISPFRPVPGTHMEQSMPFSDEELLYIYQKASEICAKYHLSLGPKCDECKNNTLAI